MDCTQEHTAGFNSHHCSGRKVDDSDKSFAYKLFGLIESVDAAQYSAVCSRAVVKRELKEFLALLYRFAGLDLNGAEILFAECIKINRIFKERLDNYL